MREAIADGGEPYGFFVVAFFPSPGYTAISNVSINFSFLKQQKRQSVFTKRCGCSTIAAIN